MLEQLISSLKSEVGDQIMSRTNLPEGHLDQIFSIINDVTKKEVAGHILSGKLSEVMNLFSNKPNSEGANQLQSNISSGVVSDLTSKLGLSPEVSNNITSVALPGLIDLITRHNNSTPEDDPSPLHELFGTAGNSGILGTAKNLLGGFLNQE
jgi:uncharacterized protein YidB (DUF937 family)